MVDVTVKLTNVTERGVDAVMNFFGNDENAHITVSEPWPKMKLGDVFSYNGVDWMFIKYMNESKARCIPLRCLYEEAIVQPSYFDCTKRTNGIKFQNKGE